MTNFKILIEGYAYAGKNDVFHASPTTTLVYTDNLKFIVDPGANSTMLLEALQAENLTPAQVDFVYLTHYHPDHFLNLQYFPGKRVIDGSMVWYSDTETSYSDVVPDTNIKVLQTPGHSPEHSSLLLETEKGIVCVAQDVFWWENGEQKTNNYKEMINYPDPFASDMKALKESRKAVLDVADWIIPGHGKMFENIHKGK